MMKTANESEPIVIALSANDRYFPGLYMSIATMLKTLNPSCFTSIYIIDSGLSEKSRTVLRGLVNRMGSRHELTFTSSPAARFANIQTGRYPLCLYMRLAMPDLISSPWALYLDADILVLGDIYPLWLAARPEGVMLAACQDWETKTLRQDMGDLVEELDLEFVEGYFNTGIVSMNLDLMRASDFTERAIELLSDLGDQVRFADQSTINIMARGSWQSVSPSWNTPAWVFDDGSDNSLPKIIHFTNDAPWLHHQFTPSQALFERVARDFALDFPEPEKGLIRSCMMAIAEWVLAPLRVVYQLVRVLTGCVIQQSKNSEKPLALARYWMVYFTDGPWRVLRYWRRIREIRSPEFDPFARSTS